MDSGRGRVDLPPQGLAGAAVGFDLSHAGRTPVAVLGAGNGGLAAAADLTRRGCEVRLFDLPEFAGVLAPVRDEGIRGHGAIPEAVYRPALVTTRVEEALDGARVLLLIVPAFAHRRFAEVLLPHLRDEQVLLLFPGGVGGALEIFQVLRTARPDCRALLGEAANLVYAAKRDGPASVRINGIKQEVPAAAMPAVRTPEMLAVLGPVYPELIPARDVIDTGLNNINIIVHPVLMLANLSRVELAEEWFIFGNGFTPAVARLMEAVDHERRAVLRAVGLPDVSLLEWMIRFYRDRGVGGSDLHSTLSTATVFKQSKGPRSLRDRYLDEDVPFGLVPEVVVGAAVGVDLPVTKGLIELAAAATGTDYMKTGRTAEKLGLEGLTAAQIRMLLAGNMRGGAGHAHSRR
jgi:opine dehydrogenase